MANRSPNDPICTFYESFRSCATLNIDKKDERSTRVDLVKSSQTQSSVIAYVTLELCSATDFSTFSLQKFFLLDIYSLFSNLMHDQILIIFFITLIQNLEKMLSRLYLRCADKYICNIYLANSERLFKRANERLLLDFQY